ncbi:sensor histidine kinase (plasmid) [Paracoccus liaowanqingii]|uniref:histidine kinase n=1 Tax=Paracoccus liaowanqingii TaxID=2560053 RepID=A0A4Y5SV68_9RHOB|nr:sensor histidine kinase [Paracoccus liaowanqingii]QDA36863.1 sensor histidine kinase [Paracoccus liaowanqingii]
MTSKDTGVAGLDLEFLQEAALVMSLDGSVHRANSAALNLLGKDLLQRSFFDKVAAPEAVSAFLSRASRSTSSHLGAMEVRLKAGEKRYRALAARVRHADIPETMVVLRLIEANGDHFSVLNRRLAEMDRVLLERVRENILLKEALSENHMLVRELQHRVKNNIQQMLPLIRMSAAKHSSAEVTEVVATASRRLRAMSAAQEALYQRASAGVLSSRDFLEQVVQGTASGFGGSDRINLSIAEEKMTAEEAHCLSLIANELITNAFEYGLSGTGGTIAVSFTSSPEGYLFEVKDDGRGFGEQVETRSSGLTLVRALCRQIGAALRLVDDDGAKASIHFRSRLDHTKR